MTTPYIMPLGFVDRTSQFSLAKATQRACPAHPYECAMEVASLAPNSEVTIFPWKDSQAHIDEVVAHARRFLKTHEPATAIA